jgi:hypothetical protein
LRRHYTPSGCRPSPEGDASRTRSRPTGAICRPGTSHSPVDQCAVLRRVAGSLRPLICNVSGCKNNASRCRDIPTKLYVPAEADQLLLLKHGGGHSKDGPRFVRLVRRFGGRPTVGAAAQADDARLAPAKPQTDRKGATWLLRPGRYRSSNSGKPPSVSVATIVGDRRFLASKNVREFPFKKPAITRTNLPSPLLFVFANCPARGPLSTAQAFGTNKSFLERSSQSLVGVDSSLIRLGRLARRRVSSGRITSAKIRGSNPHVAERSIPDVA